MAASGWAGAAWLGGGEGVPRRHKMSPSGVVAGSTGLLICSLCSLCYSCLLIWQFMVATELKGIELLNEVCNGSWHCHAACILSFEHNHP